MVNPGDGRRTFAVAIDGHSGVGKSTAAAHVAMRFGLLNVDTGAMYRAAALYCLRMGIEADPSRVVAELANINVTAEHSGCEQAVLLNGEDVTKLIRAQEVAEATKNVSAIKEVRDKMVPMQQQIALRSNVVMNGRDICEVVLPWAQAKLFLYADIEDRTRRRIGELERLGMPADYDAVKKAVFERDRHDSSRENSPLRQSPDAVFLDTSGMPLDVMLRKITDIVGVKWDAWGKKCSIE